VGPYAGTVIKEAELDLVRAERVERAGWPGFRR